MEPQDKARALLLRVVVLTGVTFCAGVATLIAVVVWFFFPSASPIRVAVPQVSRAETLVLRVPSHWDKDRSVTNLWIRVSGEIDGSAEIELLFPSPTTNRTKPQQLSGPFHFIWKGDWYTPRAEIRYTPAGTTKGQVNIDSQFNWAGNGDDPGLVKPWW